MPAVTWQDQRQNPSVGRGRVEASILGVLNAGKYQKSLNRRGVTRTESSAHIAYSETLAFNIANVDGCGDLYPNVVCSEGYTKEPRGILYIWQRDEQISE